MNVELSDTQLCNLPPEVLAGLIEWQAELGAVEAIGEVSVDRFSPPVPRAVPVVQPTATATGAPALANASAPVPEPGPVAEAEALAERARSLEDLAELWAAFPHCDLRKGARNFVFADGRSGARVMILGEAPGAEEDRAGKPFVGSAGRLLDRMLAAIGLDRHAPDLVRACYIANVLPWRPPGNRDPEPAEIAMMMPFVRRHIALARPEVLVLAGNTPCVALLGQRGITRMRGVWTEALGLPVLPMLHPADLLRQPAEKRKAWSDLLSLSAKLHEPSP